MQEMGSILLSTLIAISVALPVAVSAQSKPELDYGYYKRRVEPIFLAKKDGHTRCVVCHEASNNNFHLEKLEPGANAWTRRAIAPQLRDGPRSSLIRAIPSTAC